MTNRMAHIVSLASLCLLALGNSLISAQHVPMRVPSLNGHRFIASDVVNDPFMETNVTNQLGVGVASDLKFPVFEFEGDTVFAPRGDLLFAVLKFEYRQRVKPWLAVNGSYRTISRLGTDVQALLVAGLTVSSEFELGWLIKAYESDKSILSVGLGFERASTTVVDLFRFIEGISVGEYGRLVDSIPSVQGKASVRYAHGFSDLLGVKLEGGVIYGEQTQSRESGQEVNWRFGASLSLDPRTKTGIPLGLLASYALTTLSLGPDDAPSDTQQFELKLEYTTPTDFSIGPSLSTLRVPGRYQPSVWFTNILLGMRYYF